MAFLIEAVVDERSAQAKGFEAIPRCWVVERTIAFIRLAGIRFMPRRFTHYCYHS